MNDEQEKPESFVLISFKDKHSTEIEMTNLHNVDPYQILGMCAMLEVHAKNTLLDGLRKAEEDLKKQNISVPNQGIQLP